MSISRRRAITVGAGLGASLLVDGLTTRAGAVTQRRLPSHTPSRSFRPGELWLDTSGNPIQAHGGSVIFVGGKFYWYGENKERSLPGSGIWHWGVRCYSSDNLYDWTDLGIIIPPDTKDPSSPLHPSRGMDRPHIVYHSQSRLFVCWIKVMEDGHQTRTALVAEAVTGPYKMVTRSIRPVGMDAGDFDIAVSDDDGKAYMYFERVHSELICADLTPDYTDFSGYYTTHMPRPGPPTVREGVAHFTRGGQHYLATSGTTGYFPNPSEIATAESFHGPWRELGELHVDDRSRTSFNSQISSIFKHPAKRDLYIALADRWMGPLQGTEFDSGRLSETMQAAYAKKHGHDARPLTEAEKAAYALTDFAKVDTSKARYVWLPIRFAGDRPLIEWRDRWSIDEYD